MSLLIFESFDAACGDLGSIVGSPWSASGGGGFASGGGRRSTLCMSVNSAPAETYRRCMLASEQTGLVVGMAVYPVTTVGAYTGRFLDFKNGSDGRQFVLDWTAAGRVRILDAPQGNVLAQSEDAAMSFDIYQYLEIKFTCHATNGTVQVRVNGADVIAETGSLNLQQAGSGGVIDVQWGALAHGEYIYVDDVYIESTAGASFNDFLGDIRVDAFLPTGDGTYQQFTPTTAQHHDAINVIGASAYNNYIQSDTVTDKDSFTMTPTGDLPTIHAISIRSGSRNPDTGVAEGTLFIRQGGIDYEQGSFERGDTIEQDDQMLLARPDTGGAWTKAALEAMEFGFAFSGAS